MNVQSPAGSEAVEHVVAIGASAGGLEALETLFDNLSPATGAAFVVITHLSPDFKSIMDELLARRTAMPVHVVEDGEPLAANTVFVIPPGKDMMVQNGRLFLTDREGHGAPSAPIDLFFGALARAYGRRATGVILSGTGADGARGARALRDAGGYVIVQSPETARFDGMPRAAVGTGATDVALPPSAMGAALLARIALIEADEVGADAESIEDSSVAQVLDLVLGGANVDFSEYKKTTILRRIARRMQKSASASLEDYVARLHRDAGEVRALAQDLLIVVTEFFRDGPAFAALAGTVIPELLAGAEERPIRIWVPAVGTGQEAYSIAMLLSERAHADGLNPKVQIFATDISAAALDRAASGVYGEIEMAGVSDERRRAFFTPGEDGAWQVSPDLRSWIVFAQHNMLRDPPFINTNLITCRNALIYLEQNAQNKALSLFHFSLAQGGYLMLGPSESVGEDDGRFDAVNARWRLFRKRGADRRDAAAMGGLIAGARFGEAAMRRRTPPPPQHWRGPNAAALQALLERFAPTGLLVGRDGELLHVIGDAKPYLAPPDSGPFTREAVRMVRPELRPAVATALERALRTGEAVSFSAGEGDGAAQVTAHPLPAADGSTERVFLALGAPPEAPAPAEGARLDRVAEERIAWLEDALRQERENLRTMLEQLETSNEELQSTNEELMTSNEELQSTNEELHSVNEELYTVNAEYERKNEELTQLTKDVSGLLQATGVGVVFVDRLKQVRRFTPTAARVVNLMPGDEGRRLDHITHSLVDFDLCGWLDAALAAGEMVEEERRAADGATWTVRAAPVRDGRTVTGAVISLIDVSRLAAAEAQAQARTAEFGELLDWVGAVALRFPTDGGPVGGASRWRAFTGETLDEGSTDGWLAAAHPEDAAALAEAWRTARASVRRIEARGRLRRPGGGWRPATLAMGPAPAEGRLGGWRLYARDAAEAAMASDQAALADARAAALARTAFAGTYALDPETGAMEPDARLARLLGLPPGPLSGRRFEALLSPPSRRARASALRERGLRGGGWSVDLELRLPDGSTARMRDRGAALGEAPEGPAVGALSEIAGEAASAAEEIVERAPLEIIVLDSDTLAVERANAAALRNLGYDAGALSGMSFASLLPEFDDAALQATLAPLLSGEDDEVAFDSFALRRDGTSYDLAVSARVISGGARIVAIGRDVTERRRAEEQARRRSEALSRARRDLEQIADASAQELLAPLGRLAMRADLAMAGGGRDEPAREAASAAALQSRVRDIVGFARGRARDIGAGGAGEPVDLSAAARAAAIAAAEAIERAGAEVEIGDLPKVRGDASDLRFILRRTIERALRGVEPASRPRISVEPLAHPGGETAILIAARAGGAWTGGDGPELPDGALMRSALEAQRLRIERVDADGAARAFALVFRRKGPTG